MKKIFSVVLALVLMLSIAAFAEGAVESATHDVQVTYQESGAAQYYVEIEWHDMDFTYYQEGTWNSETFEMEETGGSWDYNDDHKVSVKNRSNAWIAVTIEFTLNEEVGGKIDGLAIEHARDLSSNDWYNETFYSAIEPANPENGGVVETCYYRVAGTPTDEWASGETLTAGSINIYIYPHEEEPSA